MKSNLFQKLFATYLLLALVAIVIMYIYLGGHIKSHLREEIERNLFIYAELLKVTTSLPEMESMARAIAATTGSRLTLIDKAGMVLADTEYNVIDMENHFNRPEIQEARIRGRGKDVRVSQTLDIETLYVAVAVLDESGTVGYIRISRPLTDIRESMSALNVVLLRSFLLIGFLGFLIAYLFSSRLVSPIQEMEHFTQKLRRGEDPGTLLINAADERGGLARNINYLVNELRDKIRYAEDERAKLEAAFASMTDGVLILDEKGVIERTNSAFDSMFSRTSNETIGMTMLDAFRNLSLQEAFGEFKKSGAVFSTEVEIEGEIPRIVEITFCAVRGASGEKDKTMVVFHDVTRMKQLEKTRSDFVANVTHEIKTPLAAILGGIETLQDGALEDETAALTFLETIKRQAERLNRLVDDLLTLSDIELGELPLRFEPVSLESVLSCLWPLVEARASKRDIAMVRDVPNDLPALLADRDRLAQILVNVLDNAVKFTEPGGSVTLKAGFVNRDRISIQIKDTGIGIPMADLSRLGERFFRVDRARSRQSGGTGLGLSIVRHLMSLHGGEMTIASQPGKGTEVTLTFLLIK